MKRAVVAASALLLTAVPAAPVPAAEEPTRVEEVATLLTGTFDSKAQAESDPAAPPASRLVAARVPRSRLGQGAPVVYVERASLAKPDRPWHQRFYRLEETGDGVVVVRVFVPKESLTVSGKWRDPSDLALFGRGDVVERIGCAIRLKRSDGGWSGATEGTGCPSAAPGARYGETELKLSPGRVEWWERGYDASGLKVPGTALRPTVYERRSDAPPAADAPK